MRALVAVKRVVDYAVRTRVAADRKGVDIANAKMSMNPFCEVAVEEGVKMKEAGSIQELIAVSCGPARASDTIRHALAMGADRGILLKTDLRPDLQLQPLAVAKLLKHVVQKEQPNVVLLGKQAIDDDCNETGQLLAGLLDWPQTTFASKVLWNEQKTGFQVTREVDSGMQIMDVPLPAIITCDLRLNQPRYTTLPNLMKAKKKPLDIIEVESTGIDVAPRLEILSVEDPPKPRGGRKVDSVEELIRLLKMDTTILS